MQLIDLEWPERCALRTLLLLATSPDRMAGMQLDPSGPEFRVAMKVVAALRTPKIGPDRISWGIPRKKVAA